MGEVLSQNEIDNLLTALSNGELDVDEMKDAGEKPVKNYDFARPAKFSKEHLRTMEIIFEHYGRLLSTNLPVYLRKNIQVEVMNSEAVTYSEFSNALSNPVLLGIVNFSPLPGNIIIELASNLAYAIVDRMLGGAGVPLERAREFSEIELLIIERIMNICINLLHEPWHNVVDLHPRMERIETNSQFAQIISPSEMIAIITINMKIGEVEGLMNVCLPYITLEDVMDKLNTKYWYSTMQESDEKEYSDAIE
ncbi:MAG: flagellar motor switch protein FliM, partial [Lachnospiraceae bacterium]